MSDEPAVLVLGAHPDDAELGAGAFLLRLARKGWKISLFVATDGAKRGDPARRRNEQNEAARQLGATVHWGGFQDTTLEDTPELREKIEEAAAGTENLQLILLHWPQDTHSDHRAVATAGLSACRSVPNLLFYEGPSSLGFQPSFHEALDAQQLEQKIELVECHESQVEDASRRDFLHWARVTASFRGLSPAASPFAESFVPVRMETGFAHTIAADPGSSRPISRQPRRWPRSFAPKLWATAAFATLIVWIAYVQWSNAPIAYAHAEGLIADFSGGHQGPVRNAFGQPINVILDSELGGESKAWYATTGDESNRALRFLFDLHPTPKQPRAYVGFFTDFARVPNRGFDVSRFEKITFTAALDPRIDPSRLAVYVSLDTLREGTIEGICDAHECKVTGLSGTSARFEVPLASLRSPEWKGPERRNTLDLRHAFRLAIAIKSDHPLVGYLDIDTLRFE